MEIQINNIGFTSKTKPLQLRHRSCPSNLLYTKSLKADTFIRTSFDINKDLKKIKLGEIINEGSSAKVYSTNFDGYVIRLMHNKEFHPDKLRVISDPNGLILAADDSDTMRLMKFVKGTPLYGNGWKVTQYESKQEYMETFRKVVKLPDESFAQYIQEVLNIRKNGYDIDIVNPNNYLLDGNHIGIVDLEEGDIHMTDIDIWDFDPFVNRCHLLPVLKSMDRNEKIKFADEIKKFYDRIISIAQKEGQNVTKPVLYGKSINDENVIACLYYKKFDILDEIIAVWLK